MFPVVCDSVLNIEWRLVNFNSERYFTHCQFQWPSEENLLILCIQSKNNRKKILIRNKGKVTICGTVSKKAANNSFQLLNEFNELHVGEEFKAIKLLDKISHAKIDFQPNEIFTIFIKIWEPTKEKTNIYYKIWSNYFRRQCSFIWKLDIDADETGIPPTVQHTIQVPREITFYSDKVIHITLTLFIEKFSDCNSFSSRKEDINYLTIETDNEVIIKLKLDALGDNESPLELLNEEFSLSSRKKFQLDLQSLQKINSRKEIYYPNKYVRLSCFIEFEQNSYHLGHIEKIDFIPENEDTSSVLESSTKFPSRVCEKNPVYETLNESLYKMYEEGHLCDVSLQVSKETIRCHKSVLCARSPVFIAMFENDMQDKQNNIIDIEDIDMSTLTIFIKALYTDILEDVSWEDALKIYVVADKYDVAFVKKLCCDIILNSLTNRNVCTILDFFEDYHEEEMKTDLQNFFLKHTKEIINLSEWQQFLIKKSLLAAKLMQTANSQLS